MDPHENLGAGKPLKEGKTVAKPPARLLRPLSEITLTDPSPHSLRRPDTSEVACVGVLAGVSVLMHSLYVASSKCYCTFVLFSKCTR